MTEQKPLYYIGLGNADRENAEGTIHNIGMDIIQSAFWDYVPYYSSSGNIEIIKGDGYEVLFVNSRELLPCRFVRLNCGMNESGVPIKKFLDDYNLTVDDIVILVDDIDMPRGKIKYKRTKKTNRATHDGTKSVADLAGEGFRTIKFGFGRSADKNTSVLDWVIGMSVYDIADDPKHEAGNIAALRHAFMEFFLDSFTVSGIDLRDDNQVNNFIHGWGF